MNITDRIYAELQSQGYKARIVSVQYLAVLQHEVETLRAQGAIDRKLDEYYLQRNYDFALREQFPTVQSLIIVAAPCRNTRVVFTQHDQRIPVVLPAGYGNEDRSREQAEDLLTYILYQEGYQVRQVQVPEKLLAVHSRLGSYGKNNVCYVPGMGSFHSLAAFCSDLPCEDDFWQEIVMSDECQKCSACLKQCPTGAIVEDRFLIHAERCLTFFNEMPGTFPDWIESSWHHCLVGCLKCQQVCPQNKPFIRDGDNTVEFTAEETDWLLKGHQFENFPAHLNTKLRELGLRYYRRVLARNLNVVLKENRSET
jgi:epoxyqueuosine reductase